MMWKLWLGVLLFAGPHLVSTVVPQVRDRLRQQWGAGPFKGAYAVVSLIGVVLLALAYLEGRSGPNSLDVFYDPWSGARHVNMLLSLVGFILIASARGRGYIRKAVKHPQSLGMALWSAGHLLANGEKAVVVIFATILVIGLADVIFSLARGKVPTHQPVIRSDIIAIIAGTVVYLILAFGFHPYILNVSVMG